MNSIPVKIRLLFGLVCAIVFFVASLRASLDDILAPLSIEEIEVTPIKGLSTIESVRTEPAIIASEPAVVIDGILGADIREAIATSLEDSLRPNGEITLIPLRDLPDLSSYSRPFNVNLMHVPGILSRGNILLTFQVENDKGILGEWSVPFRVHLYSEVWFAKAHLRGGDLASSSDFEIREVDLLITPDAVPAALEMLLRHEYSRDISPGKPLTWKDLVERSLIRKGDVVEVSAVQGLLAITVRAVARQDGSHGDLIVLRNIDSSKEFAARVIGESRAEVTF